MPSRPGEAREIAVTLLGRFAVTVGGVPVAENSWKRRHAAAVVKVLALAPDRRLHREQVIDLVWPEDTIAEAVPKLHKAAYFARRAIGVPDAVVLRGDQVSDVRARRQTVRISRFGRPEDFRDYFKSNYGPTIAAYRGIADDPRRTAALDAELADLARRHDLSPDGTSGAGNTVMEWEYLLLTARKRS